LHGRIPKDSARKDSNSGVSVKALTKHAGVQRVIERTHGVDHNEEETAKSRLGNYSELDYSPVQTDRYTGIMIACRRCSF
jgi:hypothetical protein